MTTILLLSISITALSFAVYLKLKPKKFDSDKYWAECARKVEEIYLSDDDWTQ